MFVSIKGGKVTLPGAYAAHNASVGSVILYIDSTVVKQTIFKAIARALLI